MQIATCGLLRWICLRTHLVDHIQPGMLLDLVTLHRDTGDAGGGIFRHPNGINSAALHCINCDARQKLGQSLLLVFAQSPFESRNQSSR
jgi:hypothetical protein